MPKDRFYIDAELALGAAVTLTSVEARHLSQVMRFRIGEQVELVNGRGVLASAHIDHIDRHVCDLTILTTTTQEPDACRLVLAQALPRMNRLDTIIEKSTELGMHELWLFPGERSERCELSDQQRIRLQAIAIAAMKQCGRLDLPQIQWRAPLKEWASMPFPAFYGSLRPGVPHLRPAWRRMAPKEAAIFIVGPEAGLSAHEEELLQHLGAVGVSLHRNILRTDTASLVALSLMCQEIETPL